MEKQDLVLYKEYESQYNYPILKTRTADCQQSQWYAWNLPSLFLHATTVMSSDIYMEGYTLTPSSMHELQALFQRIWALILGRESIRKIRGQFNIRDKKHVVQNWIDPDVSILCCKASEKQERTLTFRLHGALCFRDEASCHWVWDVAWGCPNPKCGVDIFEESSLSLDRVRRLLEWQMSPTERARIQAQENEKARLDQQVQARQFKINQEIHEQKVRIPMLERDILAYPWELQHAEDWVRDLRGRKGCEHILLLHRQQMAYEAELLESRKKELIFLRQKYGLRDENQIPVTHVAED